MDLTKRKRRQFALEFKADAVKLVRAGGRSIGQTAGDSDLVEAALRQNKRPQPADGVRHMTKGDGLLREGERVRPLSIHAEKASDPLTVLCRVLKISRNEFDAFKKRGPSNHESAHHE